MTPAEATTAQALRDAVLGDEAAHDDVAILLVELRAAAHRLRRRAAAARRWAFDVVTSGARHAGARRARPRRCTTAATRPRS